MKIHGKRVGLSSGWRILTGRWLNRWDWFWGLLACGGRGWVGGNGRRVACELGPVGSRLHELILQRSKGYSGLYLKNPHGSSQQNYFLRLYVPRT